jgi:ATP-dependent Zn protease
MDEEMAAHAAASVAGVILASWLTPKVRSITLAEIAPDEGVSIGFDPGHRLSVETLQHLMVIAMSGTAAEAYEFEGDVRVLPALRGWAIAEDVAAKLLAEGVTDVPWIGLVAEDQDTFNPPEGIIVDPRVLPLIHASFLQAEELIAQNNQAFERLMTLLLEKKKLEEQELTSFLGIMVPRPPQAP